MVIRWQHFNNIFLSEWRLNFVIGTVKWSKCLQIRMTKRVKSQLHTKKCIFAFITRCE